MVIASQQPHIARTTDRKISFLSEVLVQIGKAKLALDIIPDDAQEHKYYAFTTRFLSWIAQTTTGLPRPRVTSHVGQSTVSTPATATVEPPWLDVNPQGKLTRGDYRWAVHRGIAEQDSIINYPGERGEQSLSTPDKPDAEPEPEQQPTISNVRRARLPLPPSFRDQEPFVPLQQKPVMKRDPSTAPDKPREMETTSQSPDFIIFLYTMDPVLGIWNTQPIFRR
ncbi:hypothetical protein PC9H_002775 [Pleurotus ostreatus]|uniref:Uncharacterized protein n=1 Tax=Pleurotus ostreatus TaxID=5322 RepID=A0A8H6ZJN3_PLEOS|nr:uncharacterized protein PC9H_002775 [Pleurotus ostreatus]KAF7416031.1 hypothetical protein PC9H_002775 [Pleurotus ostreatus]